MYYRSLFIFRQDLRTRDNTALIEVIKNSKEVFPIFIYDTRAIEDFGALDARFGFIREALEAIDLEFQKYGGRLMIYSGNPEEIISELISEYQIDAIYINTSYSPRGKARDESILSLCDTAGVDFQSFQDFLLVEPHECEQRKVFTPYSMLWKRFLIAHPERLMIQEFQGDMTKWFVPKERNEISDIISVQYHTYWSIPFGYDRMDRDFLNYDEFRNIPSIDGSTKLSPYIRFGVFSVREIYAKFVSGSSPHEKGELEGVTQNRNQIPLTPFIKGEPSKIPLTSFVKGEPSKIPLTLLQYNSSPKSGELYQRGMSDGQEDFVSEINPQSLRDSSFTKELKTETLLNELIWREFWYQIAYYFPFIYTLEFQERKRSIVWKTDLSSYEWQQFEAGKTGYPLVDAAIHQLYETNWMHNRLRMVVASFLTKNLGIDWRIGEKWFRRYLIDYDEAVNYGNWQWSASVGADPKPIRIFNPLLQSEKFDPEAKFIKKYIPELADIDPKKIHSLELQGVYYPPIVDQKESARQARERYRGEV